jgi:hypothetical protein
MEIYLKRNHSIDLIFEAENVKVVEDIEDRKYQIDEKGKPIYPPSRDIKTDALNQVVVLLEDMIYYRKAVFDSSSLIEGLFEKLPKDAAVNLVDKLKSTYKETGE